MRLGQHESTFGSIQADPPLSCTKQRTVACQIWHVQSPTNMSDTVACGRVVISASDHRSAVLNRNCSHGHTVNRA